MPDTHDRLMELALRRGFIWPSFEIYGGASGFYDYGPLGATLKRNIEERWRLFYCVREGFLEISSPTIAPEEVFIASGHVSSFVDPMVECRKCSLPFRADHLIKASLEVKTDGLSYKELEKIIREHNLRCPECGGELGEVWSYNLMFKTHIGPGTRKVGYMRPETAQGMFVLFNRLYAFYRKKLPFGVAQIGRAYRNEISPRQGLIRLREFTQAEVEIFINPEQKKHEKFEKVSHETLNLVPNTGNETKTSARKAVEKKIIAHELLAYHLVLTKKFLADIGIPEEKLRFRQHAKTEMAHYAADCWDAEVRTQRFGWVEVVGIADRTCYDLLAHEKTSGVELKAFLTFSEPKLVKREVLEPAMGKLGPAFKEKAQRILEVVKNLSQQEIEFFKNQGFIEIKIDNEKTKLDKNYLSLKLVEERVAGEKITPHVIEPSFGIDRILYCTLESAYAEEGERVLLKFKNTIAPMQVAVFPLVAKEELTSVANEIFKRLRSEGFYCTYDEADSIGRRYARVDEIGVPYAITVDFDGLGDGTVTIRERDSTAQKRIRVNEIPKILRELLEEKIKFKEL